MEVSNSHGGVRRGRSDADITSSGSAKRRRLDYRDQANGVEPENQCRRGVDVNFPDNVSSALSGDFDRVSSSLCLNNDTSLDLEAERRFETEISMPGNDGFSRETTPSSEICLDSEHMESSSSSTSKKKQQPAPAAAASSRCKPSTASKIPSATEIEEFFSEAEKNEQKRFADKYNYDIVNDVPMEGRYQWVRLKP